MSTWIDKEDLCAVRDSGIGCLGMSLGCLVVVSIIGILIGVMFGLVVVVSRAIVGV